MKIIHVNCQKCSFKGNSQDNFIPTKLNGEYTLKDGSTVKDYRLRVVGWCNSCTSFTPLFSGLTAENLKNENNKIIKNNTGFFGNLKRLSSYEEDIYNENLKLVELLQERKDLNQKCLICNSYDVYSGDGVYLTLTHNNCGGELKFETSIVKINLRRLDPNTPTINKNIRIALLDANDNLVGYKDKTIQVVAK